MMTRNTEANKEACYQESTVETVQQPVLGSAGHKTRDTFSLSLGAERSAEMSKVKEKWVKRESAAPFPCKRMVSPRASHSPAGQRGPGCLSRRQAAPSGWSLSQQVAAAHVAQLASSYN